MIADSLILPHVWAELPEDPKEAFLFVADHARAELELILAGQSPRGDRHSATAWRRQYIWEVEAVADELGIPGVPAASSAEQNDNTMNTFDANVARVITTLRIQLRDKFRADSAALSSATKETIQSSIEGIRATINRSNLSEAVKASLHRKVDAVETELNKPRSSMQPFWLLAGALAAATSAGVGTVADLPDALQAVQQAITLVHADKGAEDAHQARRTQPALTVAEPGLITDQTGSSK
jgi:hypothetical protein